MKKQSVCVVLFAWLCWGCQSDSFAPPPPVTSQMVAASGTKESHADIARLSEGRTLFAHRCIECHTLPAVWHYRSDEWPGIVGSMSHRASLKQAEREAIVAYILTVRSQH
jgi:mono/diheme cytochrome c family protein